jgi:hypothetical protein
VRQYRTEQFAARKGLKLSKDAQGIFTRLRRDTRPAKASRHRSVLASGDHLGTVGLTILAPATLLRRCRPPANHRSDRPARSILRHGGYLILRSACLRSFPLRVAAPL